MQMISTVQANAREIQTSSPFSPCALLSRLRRRVKKFAASLLMLVVVGTTIVVSGHSNLLAGPLTQEPLSGAQVGKETLAELQQLVAPIALYPDELVAQILAASTYPSQVVEADRWLQQHSNLHDEQLAAEVDHQRWDASVKALTTFPSVLANMDKNLSWTSALGEAYFSQSQDVLEAVQVMRKRAQGAGNLYSTPQQSIVSKGPSIIIEPVDPSVCYLPTYDPWLVYGAPIPVYPGYIYDPFFGPPFISFGFGTPLGYFGTFGWGWPAWGFNWRSGIVVFHHSPFVSHNRIFINRFPGDGFRRFPNGGNFRRRNFFEGNRGFRGLGQARPNLGRFGGFARSRAERESVLPGGSSSNRFGDRNNFGAVHSFGARGFSGGHGFAAGGLRGSGGHRR
jgi:Protein of unknown function (DUF3300)